MDRVNPRGEGIGIYAGWVVWWRWKAEAEWSASERTVSGTRSEAIRKFDELWRYPNQYRRLRRRGLARAIRSHMVPTFRRGHPAGLPAEAA